MLTDDTDLGYYQLSMDAIPRTNQQGMQSQITGFLEKNTVIYQFLRFGCIGLLNTGLSFLVQNSISKYLGISQGWHLGAVQAAAFVCAVIQSYPWNRTWTFGGEMGITMWKNLVRLFSVGSLGFVALLFVVVASKSSAPFWSYLIFLAAFLITEEVLWKRFGFHMSDWNHVGHSFVIFFSVTLIGLGINAFLSSIISTHVHITRTVDLDKNIAVALATGVSLFWNFVGYKVVVFRK
jgi:putative flippase GtrA